MEYIQANALWKKIFHTKMRKTKYLVKFFCSKRKFIFLFALKVGYLNWDGGTLIIMLSVLLIFSLFEIQDCFISNAYQSKTDLFLLSMNGKDGKVLKSSAGKYNVRKLSYSCSLIQTSSTISRWRIWLKDQLKFTAIKGFMYFSMPLN